MRVFSCPKCNHATIHPDSVGPLDDVEPGAKLSDDEPACGTCAGRSSSPAAKAATKARQTKPKAAPTASEPETASAEG